MFCIIVPGLLASVFTSACITKSPLSINCSAVLFLFAGFAKACLVLASLLIFICSLTASWPVISLPVISLTTPSSISTIGANPSTFLAKSLTFWVVVSYCFLITGSIIASFDFCSSKFSSSTSLVASAFWAWVILSLLFIVSIKVSFLKALLCISINSCFWLESSKSVAVAVFTLISLFALTNSFIFSWTIFLLLASRFGACNWLLRLPICFAL